MESSAKNHFSIERIFGFQERLQKQQFACIWEEVVKWLYFQFESSRHVTLAKFGDYGFKIEEKTNLKIPFLFFNETFIQKNSLVLKGKTFVLRPIVKVNFGAIVKNLHLKNIKEEEVELFFSHLTEFITQV